MSGQRGVPVPRRAARVADAIERTRVRRAPCARVPPRKLSCAKSSHVQVGVKNKTSIPDFAGRVAALVRSRRLTLSLPRVINFKFPLQLYHQFSLSQLYISLQNVGIVFFFNLGLKGVNTPNDEPNTKAPSYQKRGF